MMPQQLYVVVTGCGRLGSHLANRLSRDGHSVVAIDVDERAFAGLSHEFGGFRVHGDATELAVLKQAKADKADAVIATTGEDNVNLMVAQVAKTVLGVPHVVARVLNPRREEIYHRMGIETVCPTAVAADLFLRWFTDRTGEGSR